MRDIHMEQSGRARILIVDSEPVIRSTLKTILQAEGYEVVTEASAESAWTAIQTAPPDVLIADIILTGRTGLDLAIDLVQAYPRCRIVLFSAQVSEHLVEKAIGLGFDFMSKPVSPTVILARLRVLLRSA